MTTSAYTDCLDRTWSAAQLDALLEDEGVVETVIEAFKQGGGATTYEPRRAYAWAGKRYGREEPATLILVLIQRVRDAFGTGEGA